MAQDNNNLTKGLLLGFLAGGAVRCNIGSSLCTKEWKGI